MWICDHFFELLIMAHSIKWIYTLYSVTKKNTLTFLLSFPAMGRKKNWKYESERVRAETKVKENDEIY